MKPEPAHRVALTAAHPAYVTQQMAQGYDAAASEVARAGPRLSMEREALRTQPPAGAASGDLGDA